ncbi:MAG: MurR/RpiR family transcriptional regulator [Clostridia bacterium]|nr:MurR/RpiR family transcriptional regulator [Clostridia bacterium]
MNDIIRTIKEKSADFSKSQKIIAAYITENCEKAAYMTAGKLSEKTGVSESTVVRFAYELGFDGYPALQKGLQELVKSQLTSVQRMELAYEKIGSRDILSSILKSDMGHIEKTLETIDKGQFERAAEAISSANKVYVTGVRSAAALAEFAGFYLHLIFDNVCLIKSTGGDDLFEQILNVKKGDVIIGISFPRYSKNTIKALRYAKNNGATVIGITDSKSSPIVPESELCLIAESDAASFVDSLAAPLSVINALLVAVGMSNKEKMQKNLEKLEQIWDEYEVYDKNDG